MKIGTKSVLFGAHCFLIHPWFVAWGWWKLYGFPWQPWLWVMFFVHDVGYVGKPNMDGEEGEQHPWTGARILYGLQRVWLLLKQPVLYRRECRFQGPVRWWMVKRRWHDAYFAINNARVIWGNVSLYHSRFLCKQYGVQPSRLCFADKLALTLEPWWLYLPRVMLSGEIREYMSEEMLKGKYAGENRDHSSPRAWFRSVQQYLREWVAEHADGRPDTWTLRGQSETA